MHKQLLNWLRASAWAAIACALFVIAPDGVFAQTVNVSSTLTDGSGGAVGGKLYLHFVLFNCGANIPVNSSTSAIVKRSFDIVANSSGIATGTVVPNDLIKCGNVVSTQWTVSVMSGQNSPLTEAANYFICSSSASGDTCAQGSAGATFNIATAQPSSVAPPAPGFIPVFTNPTQTQTLTQPSNTSLNLDGDTNFAGTVNFCSATILCGGSGGGTNLPVLLVGSYGATGNGSTDDTAALNSAIAACPQASPTVGCDLWWAAGSYKISSTLAVGLTKGLHMHGVGAVGTGGCTVTIQTYGAIWGVTVGTGSSPDTAGFTFDNICFQDMTGNGLGGLHIQAARDFVLSNFACLGYAVGACFEPDGGVNFTQFGTVTQMLTWQTKYGILTANKTASIFVFGGEFNCQNSGSSDIITGSRAIDLGYTNHTASTGTASEWSVDIQAQNCEIGIALFNAGGNHFWGKAVEETVNARPNLSIGVRVDGDTASLANGNIFDAVQVTKAGTGFYLAPSATNTSILVPVFNGTNGADLVVDGGALGSTRLVLNKRLTGWQTNISAISRSSNVVTATTTASSDNGDFSVFQGTLIDVFNVTGGTTSFDGKFALTSVSTNDSTNITTLTWNQTGGNESGTINTSACNGSGSCVGALSTVLSSGVGIVEITGDQITQNQIWQVPTVPSLGPNQETLPCLTLVSSTACEMFDGSFKVLNEGAGLLHASDGPVVSYNGNASGFYSPQPTTFAGGVGTVNTSGTAVTYNSGTTFGLTWTGSITINNVVYAISAVNSASSITLTTSAGTQTGVNYLASGITGVPGCTNPVGGACASSDDKGSLYANNTNGSTICLPPAGAANGYPAGFRWWIEFFPNGGANSLSVTPAGMSSSFSVACAGASTLLNGIAATRELKNQQGLFVESDGTNWKTYDSQPFIYFDQLQNGLGTSPFTLKTGSFTGAGSGANNGEDFTLQGGSSNSSGGRGADLIWISGPDSTSGTNGGIRPVQTFNAGNGLASKNGFIVRVCADVAGTDCVNTVPAGNSGAVRLTISGTDLDGAVGIVYSGSGAGSPVQVQTSGVYGHSTTDGAVVETNCTAGNYYAIAATNSLDNGAGECDTTDSPRRIGIALLAVSGCSQSTPCHVPILVQSGGNGNTGITQWASAAGCTSSGSACTVSVTWPAAFADTSYTAVCSGVGPVTGNPQAAFLYVSAAPSSASSISVSIDNRGTANPGGYTAVYCVGHHN